MFEISNRAAEQLKLSLEQLKDDELALRISARRTPAGEVDYKVGFDDPLDSDTAVTINGINVVIDEDSQKIVEGMVIDFTNFEGQEQFVFLNPNDTQGNTTSATDTGAE